MANPNSEPTKKSPLNDEDVDMKDTDSKPIKRSPADWRTVDLGFVTGEKREEDIVFRNFMTDEILAIVARGAVCRVWRDDVHCGPTRYVLSVDEMSLAELISVLTGDSVMHNW